MLGYRATMGRTGYGARRIEPMYSQIDVLTALGGEQMMSRTRSIDPAYARAVFENYIVLKLRKGRTKGEISAKLEELERGLPALGRSFQEARASTGLPPSRLFAPLNQAVGTSTDPASGIRRTVSHSASPSGPVHTRVVRVQSSTTPRTGATTVRPADSEDGAPPPPPYSRADPDPDSTRILQEQLATAVPQGAEVAATETTEQREQREMQEAIRLSTEADRQQRQSQELGARSSGEQALGSPIGPPPGHRRAQSEFTQSSPSMNDLNNQMQGLAMPGAYQSGGQSTSSSQVPNTAPVLSPINTGSKNPFLQPQHSAVSPSQGSSRNPFQDPPRAGSSHTVYAPPPGPPPHMAAKSPTSAVSASSATTGATSSSGRRGSLERHFSQSGRENPLEMLRKYDTVILVDDSGSMAGGRWRETKAALMDVAEQAAIYDHDGIDLHFINSERVGMGMTTADQVEQLFNTVKPGGSTPTGYRLERILLEYMTQLEQITALKRAGELPRGEGVKPMNLIVITDGAPTDDPESVLVTIAKRLDRGSYPLSQLGVQFIQIGNEAEAREALQELDDALNERHGVRDMVDTVPYVQGERLNADVIVKALLGGINRRLDRRDA